MSRIAEISKEVFKKHQIVRYQKIIFDVAKDIALKVQEEQIKLCEQWVNSASDMEGEGMIEGVDRVI